MTPLFNKSDPIQPDQVAAYQTALESTQGNILKSHGRRRTINVFLTFTADAERLRNAIREFSPKVTSAWKQSLQTEDFRKLHAESLFVGFGLSSTGYDYLHLDKTSFSSPAFRNGMTRADSGLADRPTSEWEEKYQAKLDAMILLAHNDPAALDTALESECAPFRGLADISIEYGAAILNGSEPIEQFGFVDGISQPLFFQADIDKLRGPFQWEPGAGTALVLVPDPMLKSDNNCGSYFVFRKLAQDVRGFKTREAALRQALALGQDSELAGAMAVGRFRDGTPVAIYSSPQRAPQPENNFVYQGTRANDPFEKRCPLSGHVRKVNPRGDTTDLSGERTHRIARRGITYGIPDKDAEVGLLFQCCQSSLETQFEFLQSTWMNRTGAPGPNSGTDPVAGTLAARDQRWPHAWDSSEKIDFDFGGFVKLRGGGYFFLPSIPFLKQI